MMKAFLYSYQFHYQVFSIDSENIIWRMWFGIDGQPSLERLFGNEEIYLGPINVLKAMKDAY